MKITTQVPTNRDVGHTRITPLEGIKLATEAARRCDCHPLNSAKALEDAYTAAQEMGLTLNRDQFLSGATHVTDFQTLCSNVSKICMLRFGESRNWDVVRLWQTPLVENQESGVFTSDISDLDTKLMVDYASHHVDWCPAYGLLGSIRFGAIESGQMTIIVLPDSLQTPGIANMDGFVDCDPLSDLALRHADIERKYGWLPNN